MDSLKERLTPRQFAITQQGATEPAFSHPYYENKETGDYLCIVCNNPLFRSAEKYASGSGWPSFWTKAPGANVKEIQDRSHGMIRTEVRCGTCDAHLGHLFPDGPEPTGIRYCINGDALDFQAGQ